ncbi:mitochondrial cardiolipin hydrolase-like [Drosophila obscura]|uniref:mitochondrial cardiolipin hydrolase-like n=1 Tax=Drosophila obscura TaxID=7282 RepID=UPI001BB1F993|nr:mitochondrial cardiolipin hydrolase-like [Drosophila obscura]
MSIYIFLSLPFWLFFCSKMLLIARYAIAFGCHIFLRALHLLLRCLRLERAARYLPVGVKLVNERSQGRCKRRVALAELASCGVVVFNVPSRWPELKPIIECCKSCWRRDLRRCMDRAKVAIDVALLSLSIPELGPFISDANDRGVKVRIIASTRMIWVYGPVIVKLWKAGVPVRHTSIGMDVHYNFALVDSEERILELNPALAKSRAGGSLLARLFRPAQREDREQLKPELSELQLYKIFFDQWNMLDPVVPV